LLNSLQDRGLDLIQPLHHFFYAGSTNRIDLELRLFCLRLKLRIFESIDKGFLQYSHSLFGNFGRKRIEPLFAVELAGYLEEFFAFVRFGVVDSKRDTLQLG
jgi:hypothetical protein